MHIHVITLFPEMFNALTDEGVVGRAIKQDLLSLSLWNPRDYTEDRHRTVDDRPYGGGPGMVMMAEPLWQAISTARSVCRQQSRTIALSPQGQCFNQHKAQQLVDANQDLILVAGRYEGIDQRLIDHAVDEEISLGDFVISGGELAAMTVIDAMTRLIPGALGHAASAVEDSFTTGLLDWPHYTRPEQWQNKATPAVLLSGDHAAIKRWREKQALGRTWLLRQDLMKNRRLSAEEQKLLDEFIREQID